MNIPLCSQLKNHFLLAMPSLHDSIFTSSLTYIFEHDENGAAGLVINKPVGATLEEIFAQLDLPSNSNKNNEEVIAGGPVSVEQGFILHRSGKWDSTLRISDQVSITTSPDILRSMAEGNGPEEAIVAVGYAGWAAGQLEEELTNNAWLTMPAEPNIIFDTPYAQRTQVAAQLLGFDINKLGGDAGHA